MHVAVQRCFDGGSYKSERFILPWLRGIVGSDTGDVSYGQQWDSGRCVIGPVRDVSGVFCAEAVSVEWVALGVEGAEFLEGFQLEFLVEAL